MQIIATDINENKDICTACGGQCCKNLPGEYTPQDFGDNWDAILKAIKGGKIAIDWWEYYGEDEVDGYYLRPKVLDVDNLFDASWGGQCSLLGEKGCSLPFKDRPTGCRRLEPRSYPQDCVSDFSKQDAARAWEPYHSKIRELYVGLLRGEELT